MIADILLIYLKTNFPHMLAAALIFTVGFALIYFSKRLALRWVDRHEDPTLQAFLVKLAYSFALIVLLISTLTRLGVPTASLLTLLGASSLAIGLALKDFLSNVAAGFVIIFLRPFKVGDQIEIGDDAGCVSEITLFVTTLYNIKNEVLFIPNSKLINYRILNKTYNQNRHLDMHIALGYDADLLTSKAVLLHVFAKNRHVHKVPGPSVVISELADTGVILRLRAWVDSKRAAEMEYELLEACKMALDEAKIAIAYPQLEIQIKKSKT